MTEEKKYQNGAKDEKAPGAAANYLLISAGSIFTSMVIAGFIVGYALDHIFDTTPIFFLSCAVLGFVGGMQKVIKLTKRLDPALKPSEENDDDKKSG